MFLGVTLPFHDLDLTLQCVTELITGSSDISILENLKKTSKIS